MLLVGCSATKGDDDCVDRSDKQRRGHLDLRHCHILFISLQGAQMLPTLQNLQEKTPSLVEYDAVVPLECRWV